MTGVKFTVWSLTFLWMFSVSRGDLVICVANETCVLPCSYQSSSDPLVHWFHMTPQYVHVHAYYRNKDQLSFQESRYRGRTSLFKDQVSRGNCSLQLTGVEFEDQGTYRCYTNSRGQVKVIFHYLRVEDKGV